MTAARERAGPAPDHDDPGRLALRQADPGVELAAAGSTLQTVLARTVDAGSRRRFVTGLHGRVGNATVARMIQRAAAPARAPQGGSGAPLPSMAAVESAAQRANGDDDILGGDLDLGPGLGETELEAEAPRPTTSGTTINVVNTTYNVSGSLNDVATAIAARPEAGSVTSQFSDIVYDFSARGRVTMANITVAETINLPVWTDYAAAPEAARAEWDRFRAALVAHENAHVAIDRQHFNNIHRQLIGKTEADADAHIDTAETNATTANEEFDTQTDHGRNAGTSINPHVGTTTPVPSQPPAAAPTP